MRVLFDTNVILSLMGPCGEALTTIGEEWRRGRFQMVLSEAIFLEITRSATQPRVLRYHRLSAEELSAVLRQIRNRSYIAPVPLDVHYPALRDARDALILAAARHLRPHFIVTEDKDLLALQRFEGIPIVAPRDSANMLGYPTADL